MGKLVSVIVPVYNVEKYLKRCLDSILAQDYTAIEVLVVDDGSTDASAAICDTYAAYPQVKVWHQSNQGQSAARNLALDNAKGEYVLFVDADDYVAPDILSETVTVLEKAQADVVIFDFFVDKNGYQHPFVPDFWARDKLSPDKITTQNIISLTMVDDIPNLVWNKLYKRKLWDKLRFPEGYYYEDLFIHPQLFFNVAKAIYLTKCLYYNNRLNPLSTTSVAGDSNAFNRYSKFLAYREHERVAAFIDDRQAEQWAKMHAAHEAIKAYYMSYQNQQLKAAELQILYKYLVENWSIEIAKRIGLKYRLLRWSILHYPTFCKMYGVMRLYQDKVKRIFKN